MAEEILQLGLDARPAEEGARRYVRSLDEVRAASGRTAESSDDLEAKFRGLAAGAVGLGTVIGVQVTKNMTGLRHLSRGLVGDLLDLTARGVLGVTTAMHTMADGMRDANGDLTLMGRTTEAAATGMESVAKAMLTVSNILIGMRIAVAGAAAGVMVLAHNAASEFAPAWNRVRVTIGDSEGEFDRLRAQVSNLAGDLGVDGVEAANTFYEILGSMPQLLEEPTKAMDILQVSLEAGATGFTNSAEAAKAISAVLTAFSLEATEARRVSDALFMAQGLGATTFGEIANSIGQVSGLAASLGVEFEDLLGIIATLTPTGVSTSEVVTQIGGAMSNIIKPSNQAKEAAKELGIEFNAAALEAKGLNQFLTDIIEETEGRSDILARLFGGREALALLVSLVGKTKELDQWTKQVGDSAGETAGAVGIMNDSWERQKELLGGQFKAVLRDIGDEFEDVGVRGLRAINSLMQAWRDNAAEMQKLRDDFLDIGLSVDGPAPPTFTLPANRAGAPVRTPAALPSVDEAIEEITRLETSLKRSAMVALQASGDFQAYDAAIARATRTINEKVTATMDSLRAAGVEEEKLATLADLYTDTYGDARRAVQDFLREQERLQRQLEEQLEALDQIYRLRNLIGLAGQNPLPGLTPEGKAAYDARRQRIQDFLDAGGTLSTVPVPEVAGRAASGSGRMSVEEFADTMRSVREVTSAFRDMADALDALSPALSDALRGVETMANAAARIRAADDLTGSAKTASRVSGALGVAAGSFTVGSSLGGITTDRAGGAAMGALGGAAMGAAIGSVVPVLGTAVGAVVGGLAGLAGGLFGAGKAAKEAAARLKEAQAAFESSFENFRIAMGGLTEHERELARIEQARAEMVKLAREADKAGGSNAEFERRRKEIDALAALAEQRAVEAAAFSRKQMMDDLRARELAASGAADAAAMASLLAQQERELFEARMAGAAAGDLARIAEVQRAEAAALAARQAEEQARFMESLEVRRAIAMGASEREVELLRLEIGWRQELADAIARWGETNPEIIASIKDVQDAERKRWEEQKRLAEEAFVGDLGVRRLSALGQDDEAEDLRVFLAQQKEINDAIAAGFSDDTLAQIREVQALEDIARATDRQIREVEKQTDAILDKLDEEAAVVREQLAVQRDQLREAEQLASSLRRVADDLAEFTGSLSLSSFSPLSPEARLQEAQRQFGLLSSRAQAGDLEAAGALPGSASRLLEEARGFYASGSGFTDIFAMVSRVLGDTTGSFESAADHADRMLGAARDEVLLSEAQLESINAAKDQAREDAQRQIDTLRENGEALKAAVKVAQEAAKQSNDQRAAVISEIGALREEVRRLQAVGR